MNEMRTLVRYITEEAYIDKLKTYIEVDKEALMGVNISVIEKINRLRKSDYLGLYRKSEELYMGFVGTPLCLAAYAGNYKAVELLIRDGALDIASDDIIEFYINMLYKNGKNYHFEPEKLDELNIISFTFPKGNIDCLKLMLSSGMVCDFRRRDNLKMLALCQDKSLWTYLIEKKILDPYILIIAAEYAYFYRNLQIARWLSYEYERFMREGYHDN